MGKLKQIVYYKLQSVFVKTTHFKLFTQIFLKVYEINLTKRPVAKYFT